MIKFRIGILTALLIFGVTMLVAQTQTYSGLITNTANEPLIGVSIQIENTSRGTISDIDGSFSLEAEAGEVMVFSYVGFQTQTNHPGCKHQSFHYIG